MINSIYDELLCNWQLLLQFNVLACEGSSSLTVTGYFKTAVEYTAIWRMPIVQKLIKKGQPFPVQQVQWNVSYMNEYKKSKQRIKRKKRKKEKEKSPDLYYKTIY